MSRVKSASFRRFDATPVAYDSIQARRERAYQWYTRLGLPTYEKFQKTVMTTTMDISVEDIDLLPWATNENGRRKVDRDAFKLMKALEEEAPEPIEMAPKPSPPEAAELSSDEITLDSSESEVEYSQSAFNLYKRLHQPQKNVLEAVVKQTVGIDFQKEDLDVELLSWDTTDTFVHEEKVHEKNKEGEARRAKGIVDVDQDQLDARRLRTLEWYKRLQKPEKNCFLTVLVEITGLDLGKDEIDVELLPWDPTGKFVVEEKLDDKILDEQKKEQKELDEKRKQYEIKLRQERIMEERIHAVKEKKKREKEERKRKEAEEEAALLQREKEEAARKERMAAMKTMKSASKSVGKIFGRDNKREASSPVEETPKVAPQKSKSEDLSSMARAALRHGSKKNDLKTQDAAEKEPEDVRAVRAHLLWGKWAQPAKKRYKEKVRGSPNCPVTEEDVELLPWNFNGTLVNAAKMGPMLRSVNERGVRIDVNAHV